MYHWMKPWGPTQKKMRRIPMGMATPFQKKTRKWKVTLITAAMTTGAQQTVLSRATVFG